MIRSNAVFTSEARSATSPIQAKDIMAENIMAAYSDRKELQS